MADPLTKTGRYEIARELGRGSMGIVYEGYDPVIGRRVAIKTMLTEGLRAKEFQEFKLRFQREAQAAGVLNHPNIINVFDYGEDNGILYLIMEYLEGKSLEKLVEDHNLLPIETIIPMFDQVCGALDHAHERGIVHRDIKPANIMILDNGLVKVTDFGIAKMVSVGMTQAGQVLGTPNYMSPEQVKGRPVDGRSDIFSLGIILYELITGEMPFSGQNVTTVIYKIVNENPIPPRELDATIHPGLSYVICKALAKSPEERFQTCRELAGDLRNFKCLGTAPSATIKFNMPPLQAPASEPAAPPVESPAPPRVPPVAVGSVPAPAERKLGPSPGVWALITLLGVVILGVFGAARYLYHRERQTQVIALPVGQLRVESNVPGAQISLDGQSGPNWVAPYTIANLSPGSHQLVVSKDGYDNFQQAVSIEGGKMNTVTASLSEHAPEAPPLPAKPAAGKRAKSTQPSETSTVVSPGATGGAAHKLGRLWVKANIAGARISIDGKSDPDWVTPYSSAIEIAAGTHEVVISKDGYDDYQESITVAAGEARSLSANLSAPTGEIFVPETPPGVEVFIDGKSIGAGPVHKIVPAGEHTFMVRGPSGASPERSFNVDSGKTSILRIPQSGAAPTGIVTVKTIPPGATVWADGKRIDSQTPISFRLTAGLHKLAVSLGGFRPAQRVIEVRADGNVEWDVPLVRP